MKLLLSIPSIKQTPFLELEQTCEETWLDINNSLIDYIIYYGSSEEKLENKELYLKCKDGLNDKKQNNITKKTIKMFEFALKNYNFEFMFRTNLSSYVDLNFFLEYIDKIESRNCYMGYIGYHEKIAFASGAGILLSRDMVELLVNKQSMIDKDLIDDLAFAKLFHDSNIFPKPLPRFTFPMHDRQDEQLLDQIKQSKHFHFRVKSNDSTRKIDCKRLKLIHQLTNQ